MGWASYIHLLKYAIKRAVNLTSVTDLFITLLNYYMQGQNCCWHQTHWEAKAAKNISWHSELYFIYEPNPKIHIDMKPADFLYLCRIKERREIPTLWGFSQHTNTGATTKGPFTLSWVMENQSFYESEHVSQLLCVFPTINYYPLGM